MKKVSLSILLALYCSANAASIDQVTHARGLNGGYELVFENVNTIPRSFTTTNPSTIVLDFAETRSNIGSREVNIGSNGIYGIDLLEAGGRTRAVVNLASPVNYKVEQRGNDIVLLLDGGTNAGGKSFLASPTKATVNNSGNLFNNMARSSVQPNLVKTEEVVVNSSYPAPATLSNGLVSAISPSIQSSSVSNGLQSPTLAPVFVQKKGGSGELSFTLPATVNNVNIRQDRDKIIVSLDGFYASKTEQKRMEVASYTTPVEFIDVFRGGRGTDIVLTIKKNSPFEYTSMQNGDVYAVEVKPIIADQSLQKQVDELQGFSPTKSYRGAPLSLNFQDIEVRAVLQIIAEFTNNNIVVSDAVTGNITLRLDSVPWDQALDIILKTKGLGMRKNGSVIYIAPASELDQRELDALKVIHERDQLVPARTELIQIKYANAADIANILENSRESGTGDRASFAQDSILSSKGTVSVDSRTNTLLVSDIPSKLQAVRDLIARLDEPVRQVLIDARLVLTSDNFARDLGARFGVSFRKGIDGNGRLRGITGTGNVETNIGNANARFGDGDGTLTDRLGVNLPVAGSSYALAIFGSDFLVDLELSALQTEGKAEIVSSPRVVTQDGKQARVASGQQIPYETVSGNGTQVQFQNAELSLDVTPRIAPDDRVDLLLNVTNDKPDPSIRSTAGNVGISSNHLETNVLVDNGETIVLGGVYQQEQSLSTSKVPLLGDLPIIGNAFKQTNNRFTKSELLIFVTPRIIDNNLSDYDKFSNLRN